MKKGKKIFLTIISIFFCALAILTIVSHIIASTYRKKYVPMNSMVNVQKINEQVNVIGDGAETIVLLHGLGTPEPITDFAPLAKALSEDFTVITLCYPGYGFSEETKAPRSTKQICDEIHEALTKLSISAPYTLMPHSISSVYAMEYVKKYPEEVKAIVSIDGSVPKQLEYESTQEVVPTAIYNMAVIFDFLGITRITYSDNNAVITPMKESGSYSDEQLDVIRELLKERSISKSLFEEIGSLTTNMESLSDFKWPENLPVLYLLSTESTAQFEKVLPENVDSSVTWQSIHEDCFTNPAIQKIKVMSGGHYLHWTNSEDIAKEVQSFLAL